MGWRIRAETPVSGIDDSCSPEGHRRILRHGSVGGREESGGKEVSSNGRGTFVGEKPLFRATISVGNMNTRMARGPIVWNIPVGVSVHSDLKCGTHQFKICT